MTDGREVGGIPSKRLFCVSAHWARTEAVDLGLDAIQIVALCLARNFQPLGLSPFYQYGVKCL